MTNSRKPIILSPSRILTCGKLSLLALLALLFVSSFAQAETYTDDTIPTVDITTDAIFDITNTAAYSGVISGSGTVSKIGAGALTLSGANTYTGATSVSAGTLTFSSSDLPKSAMTATDGTLVLGTSGNAITAPGGTKIKTDGGAVRVDGNLNVNSGILTVKGDWTGAGAINVNGDTTATGQLRVDTSFSYATGITLNGGILRNSNDTDTNVTINAPINVASDSSLQSGWSKFVTLSGALTGSGNITIPTDSGYVRFEGDGSGYNGALTVQGKIRIGVNGTDTTNSKNFIGSKTITLDGGTIMNSNNSVTITNDIVMASDSSIQAGWNNKTITLNGKISGSGKLTVLADNGKVIVSTTDNSFTGAVHVDYDSKNNKFATLQLGKDNPLGTSAGEAIILGTLDLNGHKQTFAGLSNNNATTGKVKGNNSSVLTLKLDNSASKTYKGVFEGAMNLVLTGDGTGTQILNKAPAYTGSTTVQAGTLQLDAGGTLYNLSGAGTVKFGSNTLSLSNSVDTTFSGSLSGSGQISIANNNNSKWIVMATTCENNSFTGAVLINCDDNDYSNQGRVRLGKDNAFGTSAGQAKIYGTLDMNGYSQTFNGLYNNGDKGSIYNNNTNPLSTLTIDTTGKDLTFQSSITGNIALVITGNGTQTLNKAPGYSGSTTVESGTLKLNAASTLNNLSGSGTVNFGAKNLTLYNSSNTTFSGSLIGSGTLTFTNNEEDAWIVMDTNGDSFSGNVQIFYDNSSKQGRVKLGRDNAFGTNAGQANLYGTLDMNGHSQTFNGLSNNGDKGSIYNNNTNPLSTLTIDTTGKDLTFQSSITGNIALVITGNGTQTLNKAPGYSGSTTVESGTLKLNAASTLNNLSGSGTVNFGAKNLTLYNSSNTTFSGSLIGSGTLTFTNNEEDAWIVMDTNGDSFSGNVQIFYDNSSKQGRVKLGRDNAFGTNAGQANLYGTLDMNGHSQTFNGLSNNGDKGSIYNNSESLSSLTIDTTGKNLTFKSSVKGNIALVITGTGTQTLDKAPEYKGSTTIESGTLVLSNGGTLYNLSGGSLDANGEIAVAATLDASAHDLTLTNSQLSKFIGSIFATGKQIEKQGDGTLQIYTGANGKVDAQSLVVSSGNLDFKGYMTGGITVNPDTVFSPGNSVGEATFGGGYILKEDATLLIEQDATGMDKLTADTFTIDENSVLDLSFSSVQPGATYPILVQGAYDENDEFVSRNFDGALATDDFWNGLLSEEDAYFWNLKVEGDTVYATMDANAVPEPSTWALLVLGGVVLFLRKRVRI